MSDHTGFIYSSLIILNKSMEVFSYHTKSELKLAPSVLSFVLFRDNIVL